MFAPKFLGAPGRGTLTALGAVTASKINPMSSKAVIITSDLAQAHTALSYSSQVSYITNPNKLRNE